MHYVRRNGPGVDLNKLSAVLTKGAFHQKFECALEGMVIRVIPASITPPLTFFHSFI